MTLHESLAGHDPRTSATDPTNDLTVDATDPDDPDVDVLIVGCGPVGVSAAHMLGRYGVKTLVIERDRDVYARARAVTVNDWTLRIYQALGLDRPLLADMEENGALHWKTYAGKEVFRIGRLTSAIGQPPSMMIYQPAMEATLRRRLAELSDTVEVRFGQHVTAIAQDAEGVTATVVTPETGTTEGTTQTVRARYVLACDGGSSRIRTNLGIELLGTTLETDWIVVDAEMRRWWPGCKDLTFWADAERPVVDIPLALGNHRWEFPLRPGEKREDFDSDEEIWALLTPMGITSEQVRLTHHAFYVHHERHARTWRAGRVLLLGDAAHMMPPWAGQGMQSGIRDADNLAWKLREVIAGRLGDDILDSYQTERAPQVAAVTELSKKLGHVIASRDRRFIALRNTVGPVLKALTPLTRALLPSADTPQITDGWLRGRTGKRSPVGRMLPQPLVFTATGAKIRLDEALGHGFALLGLDVDPRTHLSADEAAGWDALGARYVTVLASSGAATADSDIVDHTGELRAWFRKYRTTVAAIRPDRFVAACDTTGLATPTPVTPTPVTATPVTPRPVHAGSHREDAS